MALDAQGMLVRHTESPLVKDTVWLPNNGYVVLRFVADNPGWFTKFKLLSCDMTLHLICYNLNLTCRKNNHAII